MEFGLMELCGVVFRRYNYCRTTMIFARTAQRGGHNKPGRYGFTPLGDTGTTQLPRSSDVVQVRCLWCEEINRDFRVL